LHENCYENRLKPSGLTTSVSLTCVSVPSGFQTKITATTQPFIYLGVDK